ncbi:MAG TPA: hypothetical protein VMY77_08740, partial [Chitinophagaceae bacterium]|nr:hypothetical protein [Chitinophagaceae bacterium]
TVDDADQDSSSPGYRYERSIDSIRVVKEKEVKRVKDSLQQKKEELEKKLEKLDQSPSADAINREKFDFIMSI